MNSSGDSSRLAGAPWRPPIEMRIASASDIHVLCAIDLETAALFAQAGLVMEFSDDHEYSLHERSRLLRCLGAQSTLIAVDTEEGILGFSALGEVDGESYLDQLSVRMSAMRQGIGTALLAATIELAKEEGGHSLWLTTYGHVPWNRPFYEQNGFVVVPAGEYSEGLAREIEFQQRWLPRPEERVVMCRSLRA